MTTTNNDESKLDNATVRRFAKLLKNNTKTASPVVTGTVIQNGNEMSVAVDSETIVPITDTNTNVNVGDKVTLSFSDDKALIIGNITDTNPTTSEVENIDTKATTAQETATTATKKAETAQKRAEGAEKVATNYIDIDENKGITVGNMTEETLGKNAYINANGFFIRDNTSTLASFEENEISLGLNSGQKTNINFGKFASLNCSQESEISLSGGRGYLALSTTLPAELPVTPQTRTTPGMMVGVKDDDGKYSAYIWLTKNYTDLGSSLSVKGTPVSLLGHTHTKSGISDFTHTHTKDEITDFTHTHTKSDITDFAHTHTKSDISDFDHTHGAGDITSGTLPLDRGGTGQTTIAGLRTALGLGDLVTVITMNSSYTVSANAGKQFNVTVKPNNGYTFVGCVGSNTASAWCYFATCKKTSATNLQVYVKNTSSSSVTATAQFYLLCVKSIFL